jgi:molybdopterin-guanine dinucleotide biosynthesis protein A
MIERVIAALAPVASEISIIANSLEYERLGFPVFRDLHTRIGPLEAIRTALTNAPTSRVILVGCDMPFVTAELFRFLLSIQGHQCATIPIGADGNLEPLCAVYCRDALRSVNDLIEIGERKVSRLFDRVTTRFVGFEELRGLEGSEQFFENINTPEDYARIVELLDRRAIE